MKNKVLPIIGLFFLFMGACFAASSPFIGEEFIVYELTAGQYAVIYLACPDENMGDAEDKAFAKVAEITRSGGFRYFTIDEANEVLVSHGGASARLSSENSRSAGVYRGVKIIFTCLTTPALEGVYDAFDWSSR